MNPHNVWVKLYGKYCYCALTIWHPHKGTCISAQFDYTRKADASLRVIVIKKIVVNTFFTLV